MKHKTQQTKSSPKIIEIKPKNQKQKECMEVLHQDIEISPVIFLLGSAGSGKSFLAVNDAIKKLRDGKIDQIVIMRPLVASEDIGYLPGKMEEKIEPFMVPIFDAFDNIAPGQLDGWLENGTVQVEAISFMQGRTLKNAVVIVDEVQNLTWQNFKMVATRIGENCRFIFDGDPEQIFLRNKKDSCIHELSAFFGREDEGFFLVEFFESDSVRSKICRKFIKTIQEIEQDREEQKRLRNQ